MRRLIAVSALLIAGTVAAFGSQAVAPHRAHAFGPAPTPTSFCGSPHVFTPHCPGPRVR